MNPIVVTSFDYGNGGSDGAFHNIILGTETVTNVGNFDVLLTGDSPQKLCLIQDRIHVGNNRFQVLVTMNAKQYAEDAKLGKQSGPVVERIIDIVCRQVVPNGRFLVRNSSSSWIVLTRENAKVFVQRQLNTVIDSSKPKPSIQDILVPQSLTSGPLAQRILEVQPVPAHSSNYQQSSLGVSSVPSDFYNPSHCIMRSSMQNMLPAMGDTSVMASQINFRSSMPAMATTGSALDLNDNEEFLRACEPVPLGENIVIVDGDSEKKRRRRSSLLRRSASESMLLSTTSSTESFDFDNKKSLRKHSFLDQNAFSDASFLALLQEEQESLETEDPFLDDIINISGNTSSPIREKRRSGRRGSFAGVLKRSDSFETRRNNVVTTAEPLDVIFQNPDQRLPGSTLFSAQQHTGNNRLNVFMSMQMERYKKSSVQERRDIVLQMQETVETHWGGRFLMETPEPGYRVLSNPDTIVLLLRAFDEKAGTSTHVTPESESTGISAEFQKMPLSDPNDTEWKHQAFNSLQKPKKRNGLASKIRNLAANTRTALIRSRSEPVRELTKSTTDETQDFQFSSASLYPGDSY